MQLSRFWRLRGLDGLGLMRARYVSHAFARHGHETFAVGVIQSGAEEIRFADGVERIGPGGLVLIGPEVVHTGVALTDDGWAYRVLYPSADLMSELAGTRGTPRFIERVVDDDRAARLVLRAHAATETEDRLTAETLMRRALAGLLRSYGGVPSAVPVRSSGGAFSERAREVLHERMTEPPGLEELAAEVGVGWSTLVRAFRDAYGLPPHAYLTQLRVRAACRLLERGIPPAEVAPMVGFYDQAHLSRHFRRLVGVPPGGYQQGGRIVQAPSPGSA
ncbi:AraC family transcriptional regulator [Actinoallomurus sp. NPDC052308]|uniref:AraC family transcriptional regulator n=1 Tax=Actinoallomurus sp. NPDC052308 TaxID=3155530 RepID=UPI003414C243